MEPWQPQLRATLDGLESYLGGEFARGRIWYESDLHRAALFYLTRELAERDARWVIGAQHWLGPFRPDIVCYYRDGGYETFLRAPDDAVRAVIELKFASALGRDLAKLRTMQDGHLDRMAWMVYGDHFDPSIHDAWAAQQNKRKTDIEVWEAESPGTRGKTILKCGLLRPVGDLAACSDVLLALNRKALFWQTDRFPREPDGSA